MKKLMHFVTEKTEILSPEQSREIKGGTPGNGNGNGPSNKKGHGYGNNGCPPPWQ